jgi:hypothetical protein
MEAATTRSEPDIHTATLEPNDQQHEVQQQQDTNQQTSAVLSGAHTALGQGFPG